MGLFLCSVGLGDRSNKGWQMQWVNRSNCKVFARLGWAIERLILMVFSPFSSRYTEYSSSAAHHLCVEVKDNQASSGLVGIHFLPCPAGRLLSTDPAIYTPQCSVCFGEMPAQVHGSSPHPRPRQRACTFCIKRFSSSCFSHLENFPFSV